MVRPNSKLSLEYICDKKVALCFMGAAILKEKFKRMSTIRICSPGLGYNFPYSNISCKK